MTYFSKSEIHRSHVGICSYDIPESDEVNISCELRVDSIMVLENIDAEVPKTKIMETWRKFSAGIPINRNLEIKDECTGNSLELWFSTTDDRYELVWKRCTCYGDDDLTIRIRLTLGEAVEVFAAMGLESLKTKIAKVPFPEVFE